MVRIGIAGIGGRMGREVLAAALADPEVQITCGLVRANRTNAMVAAIGSSVSLFDNLPDLLGNASTRPEVLVEFTGPETTLEIARISAEHAVPLVSGTTGLSADQMAELRTLAEDIPLFHARNMSVGLNALLATLPALVQALEGYDIEIVEAHHRHKADAPSGTALALAEVIAEAVRRPLAQHAVYGRYGVAPRNAGEIGIHAVRGGGNAGEHTIHFADEGEEIRVLHRAYSRRTFALGAIRAARFTAHQPPGWYTMADLLVRS